MQTTSYWRKNQILKDCHQVKGLFWENEKEKPSVCYSLV